jgi:hypothetical protein
MSIELKNKEKNLVNKKKELKKLLKLYNKKLEKINQILYFKKLIYEEDDYMSQIDNYEKPMPLIYNKITEKNLNKDKSRIKTKQFINQLIKRKIKIKKENIDNEKCMSPKGEVDDILNIKIPNFKEKETYISDDYKYDKNSFQDDQKENDINRIIVKEEFEIPLLEIVI